VHALGGELVSSIALPLVYIHLNAPFGAASKSGLANPDIGVVAVAYKRGDWHWWYGVDVYTPAPGYRKEDLVNVGQHNFATAPQGAFTYLPQHGRTEISSKFQYIINTTNQATQYRSGHEFIWEYAAMHNVTKNLAVGAVGYYYQQTTDDLQNDVIVGNGERGRNVAFGPQLRYHAGRTGIVLKWEHDTLTRNRTSGNAFWLQVGIPLGHIEN
jgi:hypothetical protein